MPATPRITFQGQPRARTWWHSKSALWKSGRGKGKRGGNRYFYLYLEHRQHIHLLLMLDKDEQVDLNNEERSAIRGLVTELKKAGGTK